MVKIHEFNFRSWSELRNCIDKHFTFFNGFIFRGHADIKWKLESTLTRALNKIDAGIYKDSLIAMHLDNFKQNLRGRSQQDLNNISENELYAIGQHFGLYTPLLDWTNSPYVALFFALQGNSTSGKRCLWGIHNYLVNEINSSRKKPKETVEIIKPLSNDNPRIVSQQGLFLKLPINSALEDLFQETETTLKGGSIYKIVFSDKIREEALASLNNMNINNLTLFPDLIGSSHQTNYILELYPYLINKQIEVWRKVDLKTPKN